MARVILGWESIPSKAGEFVGPRRLPAVGAVPGEHGRRHGRETPKSIEFRSMPPAPGDFSKSEHITALYSPALMIRRFRLRTEIRMWLPPSGHRYAVPKR